MLRGGRAGRGPEDTESKGKAGPHPAHTRPRAGQRRAAAGKGKRPTGREGGKPCCELPAPQVLASHLKGCKELKIS